MSLGFVGRYELLSRLGAGGMGEIFLARTTGAGGFEKRVVIKRILPHLAADPTFVQRLIEEGKLVVQLRHAGIAQVLDMGEEGGTSFIAMEHVDGRDLAELMRLARASDVPLPTPIVLNVLVRVLEALDYAHRATDADGAPMGIIHRDVSPANVMVSRTGEVKLLDFGIAKATERVDTSVSGAIRGKYSYMSPQQAEGKPLDARTDLFSVGVMAWEMFTGERPFDGTSDVVILDRIRFHDPGSLADHADVPADVAAVVDRLLAKDPDARWSSADDAVRALQRCLVQTGTLPSTRDLAEWVQRIIDTLPPALRDHAGTPLSLDDALRMGLDGPSAVNHTISATEGPGAGAAAPTGTTNGATRSPELRASRGTEEPRIITVAGPTSRRRTLLLVTLVAFNVALLVAVAWLVLRETNATNGAAEGIPTPAAAALGADASGGDGASAPADDVRVASAPARAPSATAAAGDVTSTGADPFEAGARGALDAEDGDERADDAGGGAGRALAAAAPAIFRPEVTVRVVTRPRGARVSSRPRGGDAITVRQGTRVLVTAAHEGYHTRTEGFVADGDGTHVMALTAQAPEARGTIHFRVRPAQGAVVTIDGARVEPDARGIVQMELPVGGHRVRVSADCEDARTFEVRADRTTALHLDAKCED